MWACSKQLPLFSLVHPGRFADFANPDIPQPSFLSIGPCPNDSCNGAIVSDAEGGDVVQMSGDQRTNIHEFLVDQQICAASQVRKVEKRRRGGREEGRGGRGGGGRGGGGGIVAS